MAPTREPTNTRVHRASLVSAEDEGVCEFSGRTVYIVFGRSLLGGLHNCLFTFFFILFHDLLWGEGPAGWHCMRLVSWGTLITKPQLFWADPFAMLEGLDTHPQPSVDKAPGGKGSIDLDALYGLGTPAPTAGGGLAGFGQPLQQQRLGSAVAPPLTNNFGLGDLMGEARLRPPVGIHPPAMLPVCAGGNCSPGTLSCQKAYSTFRNVNYFTSIAFYVLFVSFFCV